MTKNVASNQFTSGLVMDLNPIITPNNIWTDALNATVITNNGNEGVLLNDMGNGRVGTAYLPDGYIPVGSCEFGDIIYIASYNPLINKCQLGCFPSPQRNITNDTVNDPKLSLSANEFQEIALNEDQEEIVTGKIISNTVLKILFKDNLTAGDKYIIAAEGIANKENQKNYENYLTDLGNTDHVKDAFPRLYKMKVVSIEEDGKIIELSDGLKWYDSQKDYFILDGRLTDNNGKKLDLDEWRSAVNSAYSIFSSKVSGKLAIIAELETITGFSCTWGVDISDRNTKISVENSQQTELGYYIVDSEYILLNPSSKLNYTDKIKFIYRCSQNHTVTVVPISDEDPDFKPQIILPNIEGNLGKEWTEYIIDINTIEEYNFNHRSIDQLKIIFSKAGEDLVEIKDIELIDDLKFSNYNINFLVNWETDNNNINPSGIVLTQSEWLSNPIIPLADDQEYDVKNNVPIPISYPIDGTSSERATAEGYYSSEITRSYIPESDISYDDFKNGNKNYKDAVKVCIDHIKYENPLQYEETEVFSKIIRASSNNTYYLNANSYDDGKYYNKKKEDGELPEVELNDDLVNNEFKYPIKKDFHTFTLPNKQTVNGLDINILESANCKYNYEISPCMPYGILEQYALKGTIDFSKIGSKHINLNTWKYYNQEGYSTLTWGFDAYTEPNHIISEIVLEFYDNFGKAAALHLPNKESYNGVFTNYITLDVPYLSKYDYNNELIYHRGLDLDIESLIDDNLYTIYNTSTGDIKRDENGKVKTYLGKDLKDPNNTILATYNVCANDSGIIYSKKLYLVKIFVKYCSIGPLGLYIPEGDPIVETRWFWTTTLFNDLYQQEQDFKNLLFTLDLNPELSINSTDTFKTEIDYNTFVENPNFINEKITNDRIQSLSAIKQLVDSKDSNINIKVGCSFLNTYNNVYSLKMPNDGETDGVNLLTSTLYLGKESVANSPELPEIKYSNRASTIDSTCINPNNDAPIVPTYIVNNKTSEVTIGDLIPFNPLIHKPETLDDKKNDYKNSFYFNFYLKSVEDPDKNTIIIIDGEEIKKSSNDVEYLNSKLEVDSITRPLFVQKSLKDSYNNGFKMQFKGLHFSKYYFENEETFLNCKVLKTFINTFNDYNYYSIDPTTKCFTRCLSICLGDHLSAKSIYNISILRAKYNSSSITVENSVPKLNLSTSGLGPFELFDMIEPASSRYGDGDVSYQTMYRDLKEKLLKQNLNFLIPVIWARSETKDFDVRTFATYDANNEQRYLSKIIYVLEKINKDRFQPVFWVGTCGCFDSEGGMNIADLVTYRRHISKTSNTTWTVPWSDISPIYYGLRTNAILQNSFYLDGYENKLVYKLNNWVYLDNNYSQYARDLIAVVKPNRDIDASKCILINGWDYVRYLDLLLSNYESETKDEKKYINESNVSLQLNSCQKTFPFIILFLYIAPSMIYDLTEKYIVYAYDTKEKLEKYLLHNNVSIQPNKIYCLAYNGTPKFNSKNQIEKMDFHSYSVQELSDNCYFPAYFSHVEAVKTPEGIVIKQAYNKTILTRFNSNFIRNLQVVDGRLKLVNPLNSDNTYIVRTHDGDRIMTDFPKDILYFLTPNAQHRSDDDGSYKLPLPITSEMDLDFIEEEVDNGTI